MNNAAVAHILDGDELRKWIQRHYASQPDFRDYAADQNGYISDDVINAWLSYNKGCTVIELYLTHSHSLTESTLCSALDRLQQEHGNIAFLGKMAEHTIAFRKAGRHWYLLDSQQTDV
jgi:hypothetical protein